MSVYWKEHLLNPSSSTCSTHVTTWLAGQVKCHYQYSMTSRWKMSKIKMDVIMKQLKEYTNPRPVHIRIYVSILRDNLSSTTGTGPWNTPVTSTLLTTSLSSPGLPKLFSRVGSPKLIPRSPICFEKSMKVSMEFFNNIENSVKYVLKKMVISCEYDVFICF